MTAQKSSGKGYCFNTLNAKLSRSEPASDRLERVVKWFFYSYRTEDTMTKDEAIKLYESKFWETMTYEERAKFQMFEPLLCMPFNIFHEAIEKTLGRPVWTHEFGLNYDGLQKELLGQSPAPSMEDIINMIPEDKRMIVVHT
jgi:hypothetical protein